MKEKVFMRILRTDITTLSSKAGWRFARINQRQGKERLIRIVQKRSIESDEFLLVFREVKANPDLCRELTLEILKRTANISTPGKHLDNIDSL